MDVRRTGPECRVDRTACRCTATGVGGVRAGIDDTRDIGWGTPVLVGRAILVGRMILIRSVMVDRGVPVIPSMILAPLALAVTEIALAAGVVTGTTVVFEDIVVEDVMPGSLDVGVVLLDRAEIASHGMKLDIMKLLLSRGLSAMSLLIVLTCLCTLTSLQLGPRLLNDDDVLWLPLVMAMRSLLVF